MHEYRGLDSFALRLVELKTIEECDSLWQRRAAGMTARPSQTTLTLKTPWLLRQQRMHMLSIVVGMLFDIPGLVAVVIVDGPGGNGSFEE